MPASPLIEQVLAALWRTSWQASLLILLVLLAQVILRRRLSPGWRSALWLLVVLRLSLPVTPSSHWSVFNLAPRLDPHRPSSLDPTEPTDAQTHRSAGLRHGVASKTPPEPIRKARMRRGEDSEYLRELTPEIFDDALVRALSETPWTPGTDADLLPAPQSTVLPLRPAGNSARRWLPILLWTWLCGVAILGARIVCGAALLARRIRLAARVTDRTVLELLERSRRTMGVPRSPSLVETAVDSPALFGLVRPRLLLPPGMLRRLNDSELRHVFLHELAHLRRHDVLLNWIAAFLQVLHWFNPIVWSAMARMRLDRELACDALVLARSDTVEQRAYGATLLTLARGLSGRRVAGLVGISEGGTHVKQRIRAIASYKRPSRSSMFAGVSILLLLAAVSLTDARANRDAEAEDNERSEPASAQVEKPVDYTVQPEIEQTLTTPPQADPTAGGEAPVDGEIDVLPTPDPLASTKLDHPLPGQLAIQSKLDRIILNEVQFEGVALLDALNYLGTVARERDPDQEGINFLVNTNLADVIVRATPVLRKTRLRDVLDTITRAADKPIHYSVLEFAVHFTLAPPELLAELETRVFKVNPNTFLEGLYAVGTLPLGDPVASPGQLGGIGGNGGFGGAGDGIGRGGLPGVTATNLTQDSQRVIRDFFTATGVNVFPPNQIYFNDRKGVLMVRATSAELDVIQQAIEVLNEPPPQIALQANPDERARERRPPRMQIDPWNVADTAPELPRSEPAPDSDDAQHRRSIESKLNDIVLDEISFDGVPLWKAVRQLEAESILQDLEGHGVRIYLDEPLNALHFKNSVDPTTGRSEPWFALESIVIRILPPIRKVRMGDVLDALVRVADAPIQYTISNSGIVFSRKPPEESSQLEIRIYRVDPKRFEESLRRIATLPRLSEEERAVEPTTVTSPNATRETGDFGALLRRFLTAAGVNPWPPNQVYFGDRKGVLMVRATTQELDSLQSALEVMVGPQPKVQLEVRAVELTRTESREMGFDWFLGNTPAQPNATGVMGILTERQFPVVLGALERRPDLRTQTVDVLKASSGQQIRSSWKMADGIPLTLDCVPGVHSDEAGVEFLDLRLILVVGPGDAKAKPLIEEDTTAVVLPSDDTILRRAVVWSGQTVVLGHPPNVEPWPGPDTEASRKQLLVFVTATLLDSTSDGSTRQSFDPDTIPPQD